MAGRRDPALYVSVSVSLALALTVAAAPAAPWRAPLAILAGVWAPGYALLALAYPRGALHALERHALATGVGLCLLPLFALLASESVGLAPLPLALVQAGLTIALAALAWWRRADGEAEPVARTALPSTRATLAIVAAALLLAASVEAHARITASAEPASLAMAAPGGPLDLRPDVGETIVVRVTARAGAETAEGALVVRWANATIAEERVALAAGEARAIEVTLDTTDRGTFPLQATWLDLETHATFVVGG